MSRARPGKRPKSAKMYKPVGFVVGWLGGALAGMAFQQVWRIVAHEDDAPDDLDEDRGWGEVLAAAAIQGAIFATVRSAMNRGGAIGVKRLTGTWPS